MGVTFSGHNIRLNDGTRTKPDFPMIEEHPWFLSSKKLLQNLYGQELRTLTLVDFGCLEGATRLSSHDLG